MSIVTWLNNSAGFNDGANVLSYIGSIGLLSWLVHRWEAQCRANWWCWRTGQVEVKGTTWKACPKHSTAERHHAMRLKHAHEHPERQGHGITGRLVHRDLDV